MNRGIEMNQASAPHASFCRALAGAVQLGLCGVLALGCASRVSGNDMFDDEEESPGPDWERPDAGTPVDEGEFECGEETFTLTESQESFEVPENVVYMKVKAWGAGANGESNEACANCPCNYSDGGIGGYSEAIFAVQPGAILSVVVGQRGRSGTSGETPFRYGFGAHGGGGLTGVFTGGEEVGETENDRALIIAGGGGSAGWSECRPGGTGNHPASGGQADMHGEFGASEGVNGGGGGYLGGNGGASRQAGSGGQGFISDQALEPVMLWSEPGTINPPRIDDPDYDGVAGTTEMPGLLRVEFACEYPGVEEPPEDPPQVD